MKLGFLVLVAFFLVNGGWDTECCTEERCLICRDVNCKCEVFGCGDDEKMSLKKLILHFLQKAQRKTEEDDDRDEDTITPIVRILRDILKRASRLNINEELAIRDMILSRLRTLEAKCPCLDQPHETMAKKFLRLLLEKCLVCDCGIVPCECLWSKKTCEPPTGTYWFQTTNENLRKERPKRECCKEEDCRREVWDEKRRAEHVCRECPDFDNRYKCRRFFGDEAKAICNEFSICTDCDSCQVVVLKGKNEIWLLCDGCRPINSPYVHFTKGGCPVKVTSTGKKRLIKIRTRYLQLNDFRPQQMKNKCDRSDFECPSLSKLERKKGRRQRLCR